MNAERWERIQELFHAAAARPDDARRAWLEAESSGDATLVDEVLALLESVRS